MNETQALGGAVLYLVFFLVFMLPLSILLTRWIFKVNKSVNAAEASMALLASIAKKQGVPEEEVKKILDHTLGTDRSKHIKYIVG
jgi:uncharacterized protein YybS (DUF2232 family)